MKAPGFWAGVFAGLSVAAWLNMLDKREAAARRDAKWNVLHDSSSDFAPTESDQAKDEADKNIAALQDIREIAAREWKADETNYEFYGDIAGIAEQALGIDSMTPFRDEQSPIYDKDDVKGGTH